ncbi:hypothetical protein P4O66_016129, partial [Electrophorus voltai]
KTLVILSAKLLLKDLCKEQFNMDENIERHAEECKRWLEDVTSLTFMHLRQGRHIHKKAMWTYSGVNGLMNIFCFNKNARNGLSQEAGDVVLVVDSSSPRKSWLM